MHAPQGDGGGGGGGGSVKTADMVALAAGGFSSLFPVFQLIALCVGEMGL